MVDIALLSSYSAKQKKELITKYKDYGVKGAGDLKKALPLLSQPDVADEAKYGFARGGQAVVFVEHVRAYYDVLLRLENPYYGARLRVATP